MEAFILDDDEICDWCGTHQRVKQSFDLRRMLCIDQDACLKRVPVSAKNHFAGGQDIITFPCIVPHCEGKSIRQGNYCTSHASYSDPAMKAVHAPHGSVRRYNGGCHCVECKKSNAQYKILIKQLGTFGESEDDSITINDLNNWIQHILEILWQGSPDKKVVEVFNSKNKVEYIITRITDEKSNPLEDEFSQPMPLQNENERGSEATGGLSDEPQ